MYATNLRGSYEAKPTSAGRSELRFRLRGIWAGKRRRREIGESSLLRVDRTIDLNVLPSDLELVSFLDASSCEPPLSDAENVDRELDERKERVRRGELEGRTPFRRCPSRSIWVLE